MESESTISDSKNVDKSAKQFKKWLENKELKESTIKVV